MKLNSTVTTSPCDFRLCTELKANFSEIQEMISLTYKGLSANPPGVPETLRSCSCISVEYAVVVTAIVPLAPNVTMTIPVVIQQSS